MHTAARSVHEIILLWSRHGVFAVLAVSGAAKLLDLHGFRISLEAWSLLPASLHVPISLVVPASELALAGFWAVGRGRRRVEWLAIALIAAFVASHVSHFAMAEPPKCKCAGLLAEYARWLQDERVALWKAAGMLVLMLAAGIIRPEGKSP